MHTRFHMFTCLGLVLTLSACASSTANADKPASSPAANPVGEAPPKSTAQSQVNQNRTGTFTPAAADGFDGIYTAETDAGRVFVDVKTTSKRFDNGDAVGTFCLAAQCFDIEGAYYSGSLLLHFTKETETVKFEIRHHANSPAQMDFPMRPEAFSVFPISFIRADPPQQKPKP